MDAITISIALGIAAGLVHLAGYWVYNRGSSKNINTGSWSIWALAGVIDFVSFFALTGDWVVSTLPAVCALAAIGTFCYAIVRKRFTWPDNVDWLFVGVDMAITVVWIYTNAALANLLYQASAVLSFIPMYRGQLAGKEEEELLPWLIWTGAYVLLTASVFLRLERWEELAYPITHAALHAAVALVTIFKLRSSR